MDAARKEERTSSLGPSTQRDGGHKMVDKHAKSPVRTEPTTMDGTSSGERIVQSGRKRKRQKLFSLERVKVNEEEGAMS